MSIKSNKLASAAATDLLHGAKDIARHLGMSDKQVYHLHGSGMLPTFKMGKTVCARRSSLDEHFAAASVRIKAQSPQDGSQQLLSESTILYGHSAIAAHLGIPAADVTRLDAERRLPTYQDDGCTVASTAALDHWNTMKGGR